MAPKETKRDRERRLKAQEQEATDAPTDPTDKEEPIQYDAEGVLMRPGTSSAAAAAPTASGESAAAAVAIAKVGSLSSSDSESDGLAREKERSAVVPAKRASSRSSRFRSKEPKKRRRSLRRLIGGARSPLLCRPPPEGTGVGAAGDIPPLPRLPHPARVQVTVTGRNSTLTTWLSRSGIC
jgi:hypothetical protein